LFVQMNVVPSRVCKLLPRMNQTCEGLSEASKAMTPFSGIFQAV
jgi:hypothetical protein